jgi:tetratricopeptide (TPR) repeat protein
MTKNRAVLTVLFAAMILICAPQKSAADEKPAPFNPYVYDSSQIKYRTPGGARSFFGVNRTVEARGYLMLGYLPDAVDSYKSLLAGDDWEEVEPEYAYALSLSGYNEPAMIYLDDIHSKDPSAAAPYYYAGVVFMFAGYGDIAKNFLKIAQEGGGFYSDPAISAPGIKKSIGAVSYADMDADFKNELGYTGKGGVVVLNTFPGPEQFRSGLKTRDVIINIEGKALDNVQTLSNIINKRSRNDSLNLLVWRDKAKKPVIVKVRSGDDLAGLPELKKQSRTPDTGAKEKLLRALSLLSEKKYFTSILIYRELIEAYPDWDIPYLGYTLALEKTGAFACAKKASEQAAQAAANDKEAKAQLQAKSKQLSAIPAADQDNWRQEQTAEGFKEKPASFYLGFGGGQMMFGGNSGFRLAISGRAGMLMNTGADISANMGIDSANGFDLGINGTQRFYMGSEYSFNPGASIDFNTGKGALSIGLSGGGSWYFDKKNSSVDAVLSLNAAIGNNGGASVGFYVGTSRYM